MCKNSATFHPGNSRGKPICLFNTCLACFSKRPTSNVCTRLAGQSAARVMSKDCGASWFASSKDQHQRLHTERARIPDKSYLTDSRVFLRDAARYVVWAYMCYAGRLLKTNQLNCMAWNLSFAFLFAMYIVTSILTIIVRQLKIIFLLMGWTKLAPTCNDLIAVLYYYKVTIIILS